MSIMSGRYFSINPNMSHVVTQVMGGGAPVMITVNFLVIHIKEDDGRRRISYGDYTKNVMSDLHLPWTYFSRSQCKILLAR